MIDYLHICNWLMIMQVSIHLRHIPTIFEYLWQMCGTFFGQGSYSYEVPEVGVLGIVLVPTETAGRAVPWMIQKPVLTGSVQGNLQENLVFLGGKPWENHGKTMGKPWENLYNYRFSRKTIPMIWVAPQICQGFSLLSETEDTSMGAHSNNHHVAVGDA